VILLRPPLAPVVTIMCLASVFGFARHQTVAAQAAASEQAIRNDEARKRLASIDHEPDARLRLGRLETFIRDEPASPLVGPAYQLLFASLVQSDPDKALVVADEVLAKYPSPNVELRTLAYMNKFAALSALKRSDAISVIGARLLSDENDPLLLMVTANYDKTRSVALIEKALAERKKDSVASAPSARSISLPSVSVEDLEWALVPPLFASGRTGDGQALLNRLGTGVERRVAAIRAFSDVSFRENQLSLYSDTVASRYLAVAGQLVDGGQYQTALECLEAWEQYAGDRVRPNSERRMVNDYRATCYEHVGNVNLALENLARAFALRMSADTRSKIVDLARRVSRSPDETFVRVRAIRMSAATPTYQFELKNLGGETVALKSIDGKAVLVSFFYPSCAPCNLEFPHLQRLYEKYSQEGLRMVAINTDPDEEVGAWRARGRYTMPILTPRDRDFMAAHYGDTAVPSTMLLGSDHRVMFLHRGYEKGDEVAMEAEIRELLGLDPFPVPSR